MTTDTTRIVSHPPSPEEAPESLRVSEIRYRRLFEAARDGILLLDAGTCRITDVNPYMVELLEYSREEFLGKELWEIGLLKDEQASHDVYQKLQEGGYVRYEHLPLETRAGKVWDVEFVCNVYEEDERQVIQCNIRDITERVRAKKALLQSELQFRRLLEVLPAGAYTCDAEGLITYFNPQAVPLWGRAPKLNDGEDRFCGSFKLFSPGGVPIRHDECWMALALQTRQDQVGQEIIIERSDGSRVAALAHAAPMLDESGTVLGAVNVLVDITDRRKGESLLQDSEERLRMALQAANMGVWDWNIRTGDITWSGNTESLFGLAPGTFDGKYETYIELLHPDDRDMINQAVSHALAGEADLATEHRVVWPDGSLRWIEGTGRVFRDENGEPIRMVGTALDITERRQDKAALQGKNHELTDFFENAPTGLQWVAADGTVTWANQAELDLLGYTREEYIGCNITDFYADAEVIGDILRRLKHRETVDNYEARLLCKDGSIKTVLLTSNVLWEDDEFVHTRCFTRDITKRKQTEEALKAAKSEAERANLAKSEFLSRMSHELRTPLNAILGFGQLLELDELTAEQTESVGQILNGGRRLLGLINEVLDIARIEAGHMELSPEPVSIREIVREALGLIRPLAAASSIRLQDEISATCPFYVRADRQRLNQVLLNLLANAVKYNRQGGSLRLWFQTGENRLCLHVSDTGLGIAPQCMGRLFLPFERLGAEQSAVEGTGVGLALSKRLVELMEGRITAHSVVNEGSTFTIELPLVEEQLEGLDAAGSDTPPASSTHSAVVSTVLYIEDNLSNLKLVEQLLGRRPHIRLLSARQGKAGLELAREHLPDLILLDMHLPDINGDEVLRRLQAAAETRAIPVVMLSADATPRQIERLLAAGATAYLTKPLDVKQFMAVLDENL